MASRHSLCSLLAFAALALGTAGCARFQPAVLYAGVAPVPPTERPRAIALAVEPVVYRDAADDTVWFQDDTRCTQGALTTEAVFEGARAIAVSWDRTAEGCAWAGLGFGWDNWRSKDLSAILPYAAIEMRVRTRQGRMFGLPVVLTLEDYAGGMGFAYTANKYFERPFLDEQWQRVTVPLADFDLETARLDPSNVKQLMLELQQRGSIYLDAVRLVWHEPTPQEPWLEEPPRSDPAALPITLFDDAFINDHAWGLVTDACQSVTLTGDGPATGARALRARWDMAPERCFQGTIGVSWDRWRPVDVTPIAETAAIQLQVRLPAGASPAVPVRVGLEDSARRMATAPLAATFGSLPTLTTTWQTLTIPLSALEGPADLRTVRQLVFLLDDASEVLLDDIRLVRISR